VPGALRDLVENHMLQLLALVCMQAPARFSPSEVNWYPLTAAYLVRKQAEGETHKKRTAASSATRGVRNSYAPQFSASDRHTDSWIPANSDTPLICERIGRWPQTLGAAGRHTRWAWLSGWSGG
jgi:hypothetical protein